MVDKKSENNNDENEKNDSVTEDDFQNVADQIGDSKAEESESESENAETDEELVDEEEVLEEEGTVAKVKKAQQKAKALDAEKKEILEELQRTKADALNAKKRYEEEKNLAVEKANVKFVESLLPLCDSFHMAMDNTAVWEQVDEKWRKGVEGIRLQLDAVLKQYNVATDKPENENFDPKKHEALEEKVVSKESEHEKILEVVQVGYIMCIGDREILVRPARVIVGKYQDETTQKATDSKVDKEENKNEVDKKKEVDEK